MEYKDVRRKVKLDLNLKKEEEDFPPKESELNGIRGRKPTNYSLHCRSIRIGSYKIHPINNQRYLSVNLSTEAISFRVPNLYDSSKCVLISLRSQDITQVLVHFGRCLPIMFICTTPHFGEAIRNALRMNSVDKCYFDPKSKDDKLKKITFLIDSMTDEQRNFIRECFPGEEKVKEINQKEANEILVRSTPNYVSKCQS